MKEPEWQRAENSFLQHYCDIEDFPWGQRVSWSEGEDWPKFNFLRIEQDVTSDDLAMLLEKQTPFFHRIGRTPSLRIADGRVSESVLSALELEETGHPIRSYKIDAGALASQAEADCRISECRTAEEVGEWIGANQEARGWPRADLIYRFANRIPSEDLKLFVLKEFETVISTVLVERVEGTQGWNHSLVHTRPNFRRQGYLRAFLYGLSVLLPDDWYVQVNDGEPSDEFLKLLPEATLINVDRRYTWRVGHEQREESRVKA